MFSGVGGTVVEESFVLFMSIICSTIWEVLPTRSDPYDVCDRRSAIGDLVSY